MINTRSHLQFPSSPKIMEKQVANYAAANNVCKQKIVTLLHKAIKILCLSSVCKLVISQLGPVLFFHWFR